MDMNEMIPQGYGGEEEEYEVQYLKDIEIGETFKGEVFISEIKTSEASGDPFFNLIITDHDMKAKWVISYFKPGIKERGDRQLLYGKVGGRVHLLLDSALKLMYPDVEQPDSSEYREVYFDSFRKAFNEQITSVEAEGVKSPHFAATKPSIKLTKINSI